LNRKNVNVYSHHWFETFAPDDTDERTGREVRFLVRQFPRDAFSRILDVCCGTGRHALQLAAMGYEVTGLDRSGVALAEARRVCGAKVRLVRGDMRSLGGVEGGFDGVISMWQSFGYFDPESNIGVLAGMRGRLRTGGRVVLDVFDRRFFERNLGERRIERGGEVIRETTTLTYGRLTVLLEYESRGFSEGFEWQLYSAEELAEAASDCSLDLVRACAQFDEHRPANGEYPRMQLVLAARDME
jgi:SAM-dependent methyltransferase